MFGGSSKAERRVASDCTRRLQGSIPCPPIPAKAGVIAEAWASRGNLDPVLQVLVASENYSLPFPIFNAGLTAPVADVLDFSRAKLIEERLDRRSHPEFVRLRNKVKAGSTPVGNHRRVLDWRVRRPGVLPG